jgi:outer membrane cobalamin receptor
VPVVAPAAAAPATSHKKLALIVVTESKIAQPQDSVTQSLRVIEEDEIEQRPANQRNLSEVLRYEPGVFASPLSRNDANWGSTGGLGP